MGENIPKWITDLTLEIYNVIQKYNAFRRFREMVNRWGFEHEAEIERHKKWQEQRNTHFKKNLATNPRLKNERAGPPKKDWQWETSVVHRYEKTESNYQRSTQIISGWVPPKLSLSAEPKITQLLPLSREHELTLSEKYTVLAAIYDRGRRGTEEIAPWKWPEPDAWNEPSALSDAKKSIFFVGLCDSVSEFTPDNKGWIRSFLKDVENDLTVWKTQTIKEEPLTNGSRPDLYGFATLPMKIPQIFISYCREDRKWLVDIREALDPLVRQNRIKVWIDENIEPGKEFRPEIEDAIHNAKGALLLVSRHYLASDFINNEEVPLLLDARTKKGLKILWILVGDCMWEETFLKDIQSTIEPNTALNNLPEGERDISIKRVAEVVRDTFTKKDD